MTCYRIITSQAYDIVSASMELEYILAASLCVQSIHILGHQAAYSTLALPSGQRAMDLVWLKARKARPSNEIPGPISLAYCWQSYKIHVLNGTTVGPCIHSNAFGTIVGDSWQENELKEFKNRMLFVAFCDELEYQNVPDSVEHPAPVNTKIFGLSSRNLSNFSISFSFTGSCLGTNWVLFDLACRLFNWFCPKTRIHTLARLIFG